MVKETNKNLLPFDGKAYYSSSLFSDQESQEYFDSIVKNTPWRQDPIKMFGKLIKQPRLTAWYGDPECNYKYSGLSMELNSWTGPLLELKNRVEEHCEHNFNSALLNLYRHQQDSMGWHRDNEKELGSNPTIASLSFGELRTFKLKHTVTGDLVSIDLEHGSLLVMTGMTQHYWKHALPKRTKSLKPRLNLTFRRIIL